MKRRWIVVFAVAASLTLATAPGAVATQGSAEVVVGSQHDTQTEFSDQQLSNLSTISLGDGAVVLPGGPVVDTFEDGGLTEYTGSTGDFSVSGGVLSSSVRYAKITSQSGLPHYPKRGETIQYTTTLAAVDNDISRFEFAKQDSNNYYYVQVSANSGELQLGKMKGGTDTKLDTASVSWSPNTDYVVEIDWQTDGTISVTVSSNGNPVATVTATDSSWDAGGIAFQASAGGAQDTITWDDITIGGGSPSSARYAATHAVSGAERAAINITQLSNVSVDATVRTTSGTVLNSTTITTTGNHSLLLASTSSDLETVLDVNIMGSNPQFVLADEGILFTDQAPVVDSPTPNGTVRTSTPNLSVHVDDPTFGSAQGESVTLRWTVDGREVATTTASSSGTYSHEASALSDGNHTWSVEAVDSYGVNTTIASQSFTVDHFEPSIETASMRPVNGSKLSTKGVTLSINVTDRDFGIDGDNVTTEFVVDGSVVGSNSLGSNGTVSTTVSGIGGGEHDWFVRVFDEYGAGNSSNPDVTSATKTYFVPSTLYIRSVNNPKSLVNGTNVTVSSRFYSGDLVFEKSTSDGRVNLTGLPVDRTYVLTLSADGYYRRTVIVKSLYDQDSVYLLNDSKTSYYTEFELNDLTGKFTGNDVRTQLYLERAVNTSDGLQWVTIAGDYFGAENRFEATLEQNKRYRIRIVGEHNSSRVLGAYTATRSGTVTLNVGDVSWSVDESSARRASASWINLTNGNEAPNGVVHFQYTDPNETTARLHVVIHAETNSSLTIMNSNFTSGYGTLSLNKTVTGDQTRRDWVVDWTAFNASGGQIASSSETALGKQYVVDNPIGSKWTPVVITALFLFVGMLFGGRLSSMGALVVTGVAAVMWWIGWYTASGGVVVFAGLVGIAMAIGGGGRR